MSLTRAESLHRRHLRIRAKVRGTAERPRLCLHKSLKHLYAQLVDDSASRTILFATTNQKGAKKDRKSFANIPAAQQLGAEIAKAGKDKGIERVVFDRGGYRYHGVVKAFADAAREAGLQF